MHSKVLLSLLVSVAGLNAADYCNYHPYDNNNCNAISFVSTEYTTVINKAYRATILDKPITTSTTQTTTSQTATNNESTSEMSQSSVETSSSEENTVEQRSLEESTDEESEIEQRALESSASEEEDKGSTADNAETIINNTTVGFQGIFSKNANSYDIPYSYKISDAFTILASVSLVDNQVVEKQGMGDSTLGLKYSYSLGENNKFSTTYIQLLPTGDEKEGLGSGSHGFVISQDYRTKIDSIDTNTLLSLSYTNIGESDEHKVDYGNTVTALIGAQKEFIKDLATRVKLSYTTTETNKVDGKDLDDKFTYVDAILGLDYKIDVEIKSFKATYLNAGIVLPLTESYGSGVSNDERERFSSFYVTINKEF